MWIYSARRNMGHEAKVWLNNLMIPRSEAKVPILSHGFSRGSALFDVFGVHQIPGKGLFAFRMDEHIKRLTNSASLLGMNIPYSNEKILEAVIETVKINNIGRGLVKIMLFWSDESSIQLVPDSSLDMAIFTFPEADELKFDQMNRPISACFSKWRKIHPESVPVAAKACSNYLNAYLARKDASDRGYDMGFLIGTDGFFAEGSIESVFIVRDGILKTAPLGGILPGVSRLSILQVAPVLGIPCSEDPITPEEVLEADEIFTSNSVSKIIPVCRFEERLLPAPGPITAILVDFVENLLRMKDDRFNDWFQLLVTEEH